MHAHTPRIPHSPPLPLTSQLPWMLLCCSEPPPPDAVDCVCVPSLHHWRKHTLPDHSILSGHYRLHTTTLLHPAPPQIIVSPQATAPPLAPTSHHPPHPVSRPSTTLAAPRAYNSDSTLPKTRYFQTLLHRGYTHQSETCKTHSNTRLPPWGDPPVQWLRPISPPPPWGDPPVLNSAPTIP